MKKTIVFLLVICISLLSADVINLVDGIKLEGKISGHTSKTIYLVSSSGQLIKLNRSSIKSIDADQAVLADLAGSASKYPAKHLSYNSYASPKTSIPNNLKSGLAPSKSNNLQQPSLYDSLSAFEKLQIEQLSKINKNVQMIWVLSLMLTVAGAIGYASLAKDLKEESYK